MHITTFVGRWGARLAIISAAVAAGGCGIEKQAAPPLAGPSEFGTSIQMTASPDTLQRDGASQSVITLTALDASSRPVAGLAVTMSSNAGSLSAAQVTTGSNGVAQLVFTSPSLQETVSTVTINAVPIGTNSANAASRNVSIALLAPPAAVPSFTVTPEAPLAFQLTTFDASGTTLNGQPCGSACTYEWTFGGGDSGTGQVATHEYDTEGVFVVTLTVTSPGGVRTSTQRTITVGAPVGPTADFTFSPSNPEVGDAVSFNGSSSAAANGATIVSWAWNFGDGVTASGETASHTFTQDRTYLVRLTVTDSRGQTASVTQTVTVAEP
jgi:PKD repeat protein